MSAQQTGPEGTSLSLSGQETQPRNRLKTVPHSVQNVLREVDESDLDALLDTALRPQHAVKKPAVEEPKPISALTSLVAEEEAWLHRAREQKQERSSQVAVPVPAAVAPVAPVVESVGALPPPVAPEVAVAPAPIVPAILPEEVPTEVTPPPVAPPVRPQRSRWLMVGGLLGTAALGALAGALVMRPADRPETVVQQPAPVPAPAPVVAAPPTVAPAPAAAVAPAPAAAVASPPAVVAPPPVAAATPQSPAVAKPEPRPAPVVAPPEVPRAPVEKAPAVVAKKEPPVSRSVEKVARAPERVAPRPEPVPEKKKVAAVVPSDEELDDDFARELGFTNESSRQKKPEQDSRPESLSTSDILQVVAGRKGDVISCIQQHSPPKPESGQGRFVVRWRLRTDGSVTDVLLEDEHLRGSPFARCIESQVRSWKFSPHRVQRREPVRFPFTY